MSEVKRMYETASRSRVGFRIEVPHWLEGDGRWGREYSTALHPAGTLAANSVASRSVLAAFAFVGVGFFLGISIISFLVQEHLTGRRNWTRPSYCESAEVSAE